MADGQDRVIRPARARPLQSLSDFIVKHEGVTFFACLMIFLPIVAFGGLGIAYMADNTAHDRRMECFEATKTPQKERYCDGLFEHDHTVTLDHVHPDAD